MSEEAEKQNDSQEADPEQVPQPATEATVEPAVQEPEEPKNEEPGDISTVAESSEDVSVPEV